LRGVHAARGIDHALAIVAMSAGALLGTITSSASNISYLKDKTLAEWVGLNRLTEIRIAQADARQRQTHRQRRDGRHALAVGTEVTEMPGGMGCFASMCAYDPRVKPSMRPRDPEKPRAQD
jgi:type II secretion system protein I